MTEEYNALADTPVSDLVRQGEAANKQPIIMIGIQASKPEVTVTEE